MEQGHQDGPLREDWRLRVWGAHGPQRQGTGLAEVITSRQPTISACPHAHHEPRAGFFNARQDFDGAPPLLCAGQQGFFPFLQQDTQGLRNVQWSGRHGSACDQRQEALFPENQLINTFSIFHFFHYYIYYGKKGNLYIHRLGHPSGNDQRYPALLILSSIWQIILKFHFFFFSMHTRRKKKRKKWKNEKSMLSQALTWLFILF